MLPLQTAMGIYIALGHPLAGQGQVSGMICTAGVNCGLNTYLERRILRGRGGMVGAQLLLLLSMAVQGFAGAFALRWWKSSPVAASKH